MDGATVTLVRSLFLIGKQVISGAGNPTALVQKFQHLLRMETHRRGSLAKPNITTAWGPTQRG